MRLKIEHVTHYTYDSPVVSALQQVRLTPPTAPGQTVLSWATEMSGGSAELSYTDEHQNHVELFQVDPGATHVAVTAVGEVETHATIGVVAEHRELAPLWLYRRETALTDPGDLLRALVAPFVDDELSIENLHALSAKIRDAVTYEVGATTSGIAVEEALTRGAGVCQDHAQIFVTACRVLNAPARYVSGYLMMDDRISQDATHAWAETWVEGLGWVGFDISNGISPDERYVRIATGLDYRDAAPIRGVRVGDGAEHLSVSLQVQQ
jgi:transglutaminase-like putative cysteine protease